MRVLTESGRLAEYREALDFYNATVLYSNLNMPFPVQNPPYYLMERANLIKMAQMNPPEKKKPNGNKNR